MTDAEKYELTMRILDAKRAKADRRYHEAAQHGTEADRVAALLKCRAVSEEIARAKERRGKVD